MSFKVYKNGNLILVDYEPRNGTDFLYEIFELDIDDVTKNQIEKELDKNQQKFESCDFSKISSLFADGTSPDDYIKNGIRLLKETLSPKIFQRKASYSNRATFMLGALDENI